jgi:probable rRNA maturation factor
LIVVEPPSSDSSSAGQFSALRKPELARFLKRARKAVGVEGDITVLLADDGRLKELNRAFRRKNKPTDVLSFPAAENGEGVAGDLAISVETAARQALEHGHGLEDEVRILMLHGVLHLAGFDHEVDAGEMRARESELRAKLKLPVGLIERTLAHPVKRSKVSAKKMVAGKKSVTTKKTATAKKAIPKKVSRVPAKKAVAKRSAR